jgi:hypothetical protein
LSSRDPKLLTGKRIQSAQHGAGCDRCRLCADVTLESPVWNSPLADLIQKPRRSEPPAERATPDSATPTQASKTTRGELNSDLPPLK